MGKALVIKGADFSANGFRYALVKKEITTLVDANNNVVASAINLPASSGVYWYEHTTTHLPVSGTNLANTVSTSRNASLSSVSLIELEDYTKAIIKTRVREPGGSGVIGGIAVLFFLDANRNLVGGLSSNNSNICQNVGTSINLRTFEIDIPATAKYALCTFQAGLDTNNNTIDVSDFKLTLEKYVLVDDE